MPAGGPNAGQMCLKIVTLFEGNRQSTVFAKLANNVVYFFSLSSSIGFGSLLVISNMDFDQLSYTLAKDIT